MFVIRGHWEWTTIFIVEGHLKLTVFRDDTLHFEIEGELLVVDFINACEGWELRIEAF